MMPAWAALGLLAAFVRAAQLMLQERLKVDGFAMAVWGKVMCLLAVVPFVFFTGFPRDVMFYLPLLVVAPLYAVTDVMIYRAIPVVGAGVFSRLVPVTVLGTFLLWFAAEPSLLARYAAAPWVSAAIALVFILAVYCAVRLKSCAVTVKAVRMLWFTLCAMAAGPVFIKAAVSHATPGQAVIAYMFCEGVLMIALWALWLAFRGRAARAGLFAARTVRPALAIGAAQAGVVAANVAGFYVVDNPGYIRALGLLTAVIILALHRLQGHDDGSNARAGMGIVFCAVLLVILREQV